MTEANPQLPAADWYPDPSGTGQLRFWDGEQWTQQLRAADQPAEALVEEPAAGTSANTGASDAAPAQDPVVSPLDATVNYGAGFAQADAAQQFAAGQYGAGQPLRQPHAHSAQAGFFRSLFDLSFAAERSVTTSFVKVIYVIGIVLAVLSWLGTALLFFILGGIENAAYSMFDTSGGSGLMVFGVLALLLGWIPGFVNVIFLRVGLEFVTAQIRTSQHTAELVRLGRAAEAAE